MRREREVRRERLTGEAHGVDCVGGTRWRRRTAEEEKPEKNGDFRVWERMREPCRDLVFKTFSDDKIVANGLKIVAK